MHIVLLNDDALPTARGGSAVVADHLRKHFKRLGHETTLITAHQDRSKPEVDRRSDAHGAIISLFIDYPEKERHHRAIKDPRVSALLDPILKELKPDIVHAHNLHTYLTYDALRIARKYTKKIFLTAHDTFLVSFGRIKGKRFYESVRRHMPYKVSWWENFRATGLAFSPFRNLRIRKVLRDTDTTVIAISHTLDRFLHNNGIRQTMVIANGTDIADAPSQNVIDTFRKKMKLSGPTILFGGRISGDKGIGALFAAAEPLLARLPNLQILIAGEQERLDRYTKSLSPGLKAAIRCTGWIEPSEMPVVYASANVVTTPSLYLDAFNLMNIEAMAAGRPVVGTCFGGTAEIIDDVKTGFIVDPRDIREYTKSLGMILNDPLLQERMGHAGRERVRQKFSASEQAERHLELFR